MTELSEQKIMEIAQGEESDIENDMEIIRIGREYTYAEQLADRIVANWKEGYREGYKQEGYRMAKVLYDDYGRDLQLFIAVFERQRSGGWWPLFR